MNNILTKISSMLKKAIITLTNDDSKDISYTQVSYLEKTTNIENIYPYGFSASAPVGNIVLVGTVGSNEANLVGIPYSQKNRFKNLKSGEVVIGNPITGSNIKFSENKDINLYSLGNFIVDITNNLSLQSNKLAFFGAPAVVKQTGGSLIAGSSYTANEQDMINKMFTALKNYGLLT